MAGEWAEAESLARELRVLSPHVQLASAVRVPRLDHELGRVAELWRTGLHPTAAPPCAGRAVPAGLLEALRHVARRAERLASAGDGLARVVCERAEELHLEAEAQAAAGTPRLRVLATRLFRSHDAPAREADRWAHEILVGPRASVLDEPTHRSDDATDPLSLRSQVSALASRERLPLRVELRDDMAALAATDVGLVQLARGRWLTREASLRTARHEVLGHALPLHRASRSGSAILCVGTAGGSIEQEGLALSVEHEHEHLVGARLYELALRHVVAAAVHAGASPAEVFALARRHAADEPQAARAALRALRGGGLGREVGYLPAYVRVRDWMRGKPSRRALLGLGRVAVRFAEALAPLADAAAEACARAQT